MPSKKEAAARIKINRLLEEAGWRFEENEHGPANIQLEVSVKTYQSMGDDFEHAQPKDQQRGAIDFLLLDKDKRPLVRTAKKLIQIYEQKTKATIAKLWEPNE